LAGRLDLGSPSPAQHRAPGIKACRPEGITLTEEAVDQPAQLDQPAEAIFVPYTELSEDALRGVLESFVLREGTEYGERDVSLDQKVAQVTRQLYKGEAQIVFDPETQTIDIVVTAGKSGRPADRAPR
jgi:uncharacterized protein YheU (UPF0270 family)